jgi:hypothetical protein
MRKTDIDLSRLEQDLLALHQMEESADEPQALDRDVWQPTQYETQFLPGLRLVGIADKSEVILQNSGDLHIHTYWSDGDDLEKVLARAMALNLDAIAITDHDEIGGALLARKIVHERRWHLAVIPGVEISSRDGHIGALFVTRPITAGLGAEETVYMIHQAGGIAVAHHPYSPKWIDWIIRQKLGCGDLIREVGFDAIEATNAVPGRGVKYNIATIEAMRQHHIQIAVTGSSDAHKAHFIGKGRTYWAGNEGVLSLYKAFQHGFTLGAEGYWTTSEKISYYRHLIWAILRNRIRKLGSIN